MNRRTLLAATLALFAATIARADEPPKYWVYIGTSTTGKSTSKGIYRCEFIPGAGTLSEPVLAAEVVNPTFLAIHPSGKYLYNVGEVASVGGKKGGGVHAYAIDKATGALKKLNESDSGGSGPCHVMCDRAGECLLVANYAGGSVKCLKLNADGSIGKESSFHQHAGNSVNPARQKEPHAHSAHVSPDNRFAIVADLGLDKLMVYKLDPKAAKLTPNEPAFYTAPAGSGPRHFAWHPNGKWAYTNGELDASVTAMKYDAEAGTFTTLNTSPTLPADTAAEMRAKNSTAEIVVHPNGKHVFVSNRGHNSIATFKVKDDGSLTPTLHIKGDINIPRNFNFDPSGQWLFIANMEGKNVTTQKWDGETGNTTKVGPKIAVDKPMCIKFLTNN